MKRSKISFLCLHAPFTNQYFNDLFFLLFWYWEWIILCVWKMYLVCLAECLALWIHIITFSAGSVFWEFRRCETSWDLEQSWWCCSDILLTLLQNLSLSSFSTWISLDPHFSPISVFIVFWDYLFISRNCRVNPLLPGLFPLPILRAFVGPYKHAYICQTMHPDVGCRK